MKQQLTAILFLLLAASPAGAQPGFNGKEDPYAITCRPPQLLPRSRLLGPEVCKSNAVWAQYRKDGMDVAADGIHDVPSEKHRSLNPRACRPATPGGGGTSNMIQMNISMICD